MKPLRRKLKPIVQYSPRPNQWRSYDAYSNQYWARRKHMAGRYMDRMFVNTTIAVPPPMYSVPALIDACYCLDSMVEWPEPIRFGKRVIKALNAGSS